MHLVWYWLRCILWVVVFSHTVSSVRMLQHIQANSSFRISIYVNVGKQINGWGYILWSMLFLFLVSTIDKYHHSGPNRAIFCLRYWVYQLCHRPFIDCATKLKLPIQRCPYIMRHTLKYVYIETYQQLENISNHAMITSWYTNDIMHSKYDDRWNTIILSKYIYICVCGCVCVRVFE